MNVKFIKRAIVPIILVFWVAALNLMLGLGIVAILFASWTVATIEKLRFLELPVLFVRTVVNLYAFGWMVEHYTGLSPWLSIPFGLCMIVLLAAVTADPFYGIKKEED